MRKALVWAMLLCGLPAVALAATEVRETQVYHDERLDMTVVGGKVDLPAGLLWSAQVTDGAGVLRQVQVKPAETALQAREGRRSADAQQARELERGRWQVQRVLWQIREYAAEHDGVGPATWEELPDHERFDYQMASPYNNEAGGGRGEMPYLFLIPNVPVPPDRGTVQHDQRQPVIVELRPLVDDGEHWVLFSDGQVERRAIDRDLVAKYGLTITPIRPLDRAAVADMAAHTCTIYALLAAEADAPASIALRELMNEQQVDVVWDVANAAAGDASLLKGWAETRAEWWRTMLDYSDAPVLRAWLARHKDLYGTKNLTVDLPRDPRRTTSVFGVLGGRAAVRETLQMQVLGGGRGDGGERTISVDTIEGVTVKSHPYEEMLAGQPGGRLPLAECVPPDRFMVYVAKPDMVFNMLDNGGSFVAEGGAGFTGNSLDYGLKDRYFARLGFTEDWVRLLMSTGAVTEMIVTCPDLFFIDGTDVTVICRVGAMGLVRPLLGQLGIPTAGEGTIVQGKSLAGEPTWWAISGDRLIVGTNRGEVDGALGLIRANGQGSLGRTSEFHYMLTKLAPAADTVAFGYLSDPFIRRLVGPATKIGQLRRMKARAELEALSAGALLYAADGHGGTPGLPDLLALGYVPESFMVRDYALGEDLVAHSVAWGTPGGMATLLENPVDLVTEDEQKAYGDYVEAYNRFWRRYFDPIAVRLDGNAEKGYELTTFILPLLDSQMYSQLRELLPNGEGGAVLRVPQLSPAPVLMLSLNLGEKGWREVVKDFGAQMLEQLGIEGALLDYLGPSVHFAIYDADPVICLGSGDVLGAFGGAGAFGRGEMLAIPLVLSLATRPTQIAVELTDEDTVRDILRRVALGRRPEDHDVSIEFYGVGDGDSWTGSFGLAGLVKVRFGVEIRNGYLIISNIPWLGETTVANVGQADLNAAMLQVFPGAVREQLPGLFTSAMEGARAAAMHGLGHVEPFVVAVAASPDEAGELHKKLFGFAPRHPDGGRWVLQDGHAASSEFGTWWRQRQPAYHPEAGDFGLLGGLGTLSVNTQFEDDGLRVTCRWTFPSPAER
jgi:hypothetical protein